jgi:hypothetical protein
MHNIYNFGQCILIFFASCTKVAWGNYGAIGMYGRKPYGHATMVVFCHCGKSKLAHPLPCHPWAITSNSSTIACNYIVIHGPMTIM